MVIKMMILTIMLNGDLIHKEEIKGPDAKTICNLIKSTVQPPYKAKCTINRYELSSLSRDRTFSSIPLSVSTSSL